MRAHVHIEDRHLGPYTATLKVSTADAALDLIAEVDMDLKQLLTHRQHLDNAIDGLRDRIFTDAVCGHCTTCDDIRMVDVPRPHGPGLETIHCPVCWPKIEAAREVLKTGLVVEVET